MSCPQPFLKNLHLLTRILSPLTPHPTLLQLELLQDKLWESPSRTKPNSAIEALRKRGLFHAKHVGAYTVDGRSPCMNAHPHMHM